MGNRLEGKVAIITGAGSGMGRASAKRFTEEGAKVVVADVNEAGGLETVEIIKAAGGEAIFVKTDVSNPDDCSNVVAQAVAAFGKLNVLYNNAALPQKESSFSDVSNELWDKIMDVNLKGPFMMCKAAYPEFVKAGGGVYLGTASLGAIMPRAMSIVYSPSKAGLICLYKVLASELAKDNIRANVILPGPTASPMLKQFMGGDRENMSDEEIKNIVGATMAFGRCVEPTDIANAAVFLASDEASQISGETLLVDGGRSVARGRD
ncbi:MAG: SDR family oxidoreductase [Clostridiales Family XIII bacterium]|jgi:NAD(P)-dependent dehydrogenase (short-subunit alcohol dehydrogenase family)|nr:SDR family oxidoreductase [Clostridiales Family XIII bacterium]